MRQADPRLVRYAYAIAQRWAWPGLERVVIDGRPVNAETVIVEVLRAADGIGLLRDSAEPPQESAVDVEAAARLLASYHVMYEEPPYGWGWRHVLTHLDHAVTAARTTARGQRALDRIDAAYGVLRREVQRGSAASQA